MKDVLITAALLLTGIAFTSCQSQPVASCGPTLAKVMAGFDYAGCVPSSESELRRFYPGRKQEFPDRINLNCMYVFFHRAPADNDRLLDIVLAPRFTKAGFTISRTDPNIREHTGCIFEFQDENCAGFLSVQHDQRIVKDLELKGKWVPWIYIVEFYESRAGD